MEFSVGTIFTVAFLFVYGGAFIIGIIIAQFPSSPESVANKTPILSKADDKAIETSRAEKKEKTAWQRAVEIQKKENARQRALARQAEQVRLAAEQRANNAKMGIGY